MKKNLKPCVHERSERKRRRAFCIMSLRVGVSGEVMRLRRVSRSESESEEGEQSDAPDAKPGDLPLSRLKSP